MIDYTEHALYQMRSRSVSKGMVETALNEPDEIYEDIQYKNIVCIKYIHKTTLLVFFRRIGRDIKVVSTFYTTKANKVVEGKVRRGLWKKA